MDQGHLAPRKFSYTMYDGFQALVYDPGAVSQYYTQIMAKLVFSINGINFHETFTSDALVGSLHLHVEKFVFEKWQIHHTDISIALLN